MRILLDESVPGRLGPLLIGHAVTTVQRRGWSSIQNGKLLALAAGEFDVVLTADKGMEYQQKSCSPPGHRTHRACAQQSYARHGARGAMYSPNALGELVPGTLVKVVA